jgi:hypothetical protein
MNNKIPASVPWILKHRPKLKVLDLNKTSKTLKRKQG